MAQLFNLRKNLLANPSGNLMCIDARQPFTIKINTIYGTGNNTFALPLTNHTTNLKIETSDGQSISITNYTDPAKLIVFPSAGIYTIKMRGYCGWSFYNTGDCQKLIGISNWGTSFKFSNLIGAFYGCINLGLNEGLPLTGAISSYTTGSISLQNIFNSCNLTSYGSPKIFQKLKIWSLTNAFVANRLPYVCDQLLHGQTSITLASYAFLNNVQLIDMHNDAYKSLINCTNMQECWRGCRLTTVKKKWHQSLSKVTVFGAAYYDNRITLVEDGAFDILTEVTSMGAVLQLNNLPTIPNRLFYNQKKTISYQSTLRQQRVPMALPSEIWDLTAISIVTNWDNALRASSTALSPTGTVQDIWNYASPTATKTDAFQYCTGLTNYADIPTDWI